MVGHRYLILGLFIASQSGASQSGASRIEPAIPALASRLDDALALQAKGKLKKSRELLKDVISDLRAAHDQAGLAKALSAYSYISVSLGDYKIAIQEANEAIGIRTRLKDDAAISDNYNTMGLAYLYLGNYAEALTNYRNALKIDRRHHNAAGEVSRENNIGNVFYFLGQYQEALRAYQQAMEVIDSAGEQPWVARRRTLTTGNLAVLYQRLGKDQAALDLFRQLTAKHEALPKSEYAQFLLDQGVLYRRMGDPIKALELYRSAQAIFSTEHHRDAEIGALRNTGIARAVDLDDLVGAREAFTAALKLAQESSDTRGIVQAALYRAEVFRRLGKLQLSESDFRLALGLAQKSRLIEEQWKAQFGLGKLSEAEGRLDNARQLYREAIARIESMRAGMRLASLRSEFLADKRDVYDSLIALDLRESQPPRDEIFSLMEGSRARAFEERTRSARAPQPTLQQVQTKLPRDTIFIEFYIGTEGGAALWFTQSEVGIVAHLPSQATLQNGVADFARAIENGDDRWKGISLYLGRQLLAGIPAARHMIIAPDGPLALLPFEILTRHDSGLMLIEKSDLSYTPAARVLLQDQPVSGVRMPWRTQLVAYGDPPVSGPDALAGSERWQPLAEAADEIRSIAGLLPGRSMTFLGAEARKHDLLTRRFDGVSMLHLTTHAVIDPDNPDRSHILMAPDPTEAPLAYLFLQEVYGLDLKGVDLATISACETARGKMLRGDGPQAFNQAFLAAGARATVTSLWRVPDRPTAAFMKQFYFFLAQRQPKSGALRSAKLQFLHSNSAWSHPRYWSAFVLYGEGASPVGRVIPWHWLAGIAGLALLAIVFLVKLVRVARR